MTGSGFAIADTLVHGEGNHRRRKYTNALAENRGAPRAMTGGDGVLGAIQCSQRERHVRNTHGLPAARRLRTTPMWLRNRYIMLS